MSPTNRILVVKGRKSGKWSFPKGHKIGSESYISCAVRETWEETGISLAGFTPVACHKMASGEYYFFELPDELAPQIQDNGEIEDAQWLSLEEMAALDCNIDISCFLSRMNRRYKRGAQMPPIKNEIMVVA